MKKIFKAVTPKLFKKFRKKDNLFTKDTISLDDKKNKKYLDDFAYQEFLRKFKNESSDSNEEQWNNCNLSRNKYSLFQAIELILAFNETNERKEVKMCKHCLKPFIAKNLKSDYDTASCRNVANVYRNRAKNK